MKKMPIIRWIAFFAACFAGVMIPNVSRADVGPKPSVTINFKGLEKENYYVTLLGKESECGPWSSEGHWSADRPEEEVVLSAFQEYKDSFYFLGYYEDCTKTNQFCWSYRPPESFKILLYFPKYQKLIVCGDIYECYAFDSYYTVTIKNVDIAGIAEDCIRVRAGQEKNSTTVVRSYDYGREILLVVLRTILTIVIEILLALAFLYWHRRQLAVICLTNILTQSLLNISLNIIAYYHGISFTYLFGYLMMEFLVFVVEGLIYRKYLKREEKFVFNEKVDNKYLPWIYAFVANGVSFMIGIFLIGFVPGIF